MNFRNAFCVYIFLFPLLPAHVGIYVFPFLPVIKLQRVLTLVMLAIVLYERRFLTLNSSFFRKNPFKIWVALYVVSICLSGMFTYGRMYTNVYYIASLYFENIFFAILVCGFIRQKEDFLLLFKLLSWAALFIALVAVVERITGVNIYSLLPTFNEGMTYAVREVSREGAVRARSTFDHPISLGSYLVLSVPAVMYFTRNRPTKAILFISLLFAAMIFSQSRTAIIGFAIMQLFLMVVVLRNDIRLVMLMCGLISVSALFLIANIDNFQRYENIASIYLNPLSSHSAEALESTLVRKVQFYKILELSKARPILGYGYDPKVRDSFGLKTIDSYYLYTLHHFGALGLCSFLLLQIAIVTRLIFIRFIEMKDLNLYLLAAVVTFNVMIIGVSLTSFHFMFWIFLGIICSSAEGTIGRCSNGHVSVKAEVKALRQ